MPYRSVLVVDDDPIQADCLVDYLIQKGITARAVLNASAAKALLEVQYFGVLVIDLYMPDASGMELVEWVRSTERLGKVKVLLWTAGSEEVLNALRSKMTIGHVNVLMQKPVTVEELYTQIKQLVEANVKEQKLTFTVLSEEEKRDDDGIDPKGEGT